jgi:membrane-associated protease RseP (regulator of RpoE activity)
MWLSLLFILILAGIVTYIVLRQTVSQLVTVPLWLLWSVLMTPPVLTGATIASGKQVPPLPFALVICAICWLIYWRLLDVHSERLRQGVPPKPSPVEVDQATNLPESLPISAPEQPEPSAVRPIDPAEEATLRTCFAWNVFFLEKIEYRPQAVLCRGKLRTDSDAAYTTIKQNVERLFGDRFFILFQYSLSTGKPFFALVPNSPPLKVTRSQWWLERSIGLGLFCLALAATTYAGATLARTHTGQIGEIIQTGLPYGLSIVASLGIRDVGRYLVAQFYRIDCTFPYFIPLPFLPGTYGCFVQLRSPIPHRKAVFDLGFVSASLGLAVAIPLLIWGLAHSPTVPLDPKATLFSFHAIDPRFSLLFSVLSKLALGTKFGAETAIDLHIVAIAAYFSLLILTIDLMPLRRLSGGHIVHAMFGQKPSAIVSQLSKVVLLILGFIRFKASGFGHTDLLFLAIAISLIPAIDEPALNDVSELNHWRDALGILMLAITISILIPVPTVLLQMLGI